MGYCVNYTHINYECTAASKVALIAKYPDILEELDDEGFMYHEDSKGGLIVDDWEGEKWRGQEEVLDKLAEFHHFLHYQPRHYQAIYYIGLFHPLRRLCYAIQN